MIAVVAGVPGVGKTSVIRKAIASMNVHYINYGDLFEHEARRLLNINNRDDLRFHIPYTMYRLVDRAVLRKLEKVNRPTILDTHLIIATKYTFMPGFDMNKLNTLPVSLVVVITAPEDEIKRRRVNDKRVRGIGIEKHINLHQHLTIDIAAQLSALKGIPFTLIENRDGRINEAAERLKNVINEWLKGIDFVEV